MTIQINYKKDNSTITSSNLVLFVDDKFNINGLKKHFTNAEFLYVSDLLKNSDLKKIYFYLRLIQKKQYF